jgi:surface protein
MMNEIKSDYILKKIFSYITQGNLLKLIYYNKKLKRKLNISINLYIRYSNQIVIDIIPDKEYYFLNYDRKERIFIYILDEKNKSFFHIYFDEKSEEIKRNFLEITEDVSKIRVKIDMEVDSLVKLFYECHCIKEIKFIKFNRTDFSDYNCMFYNCINLINLDASKIKTNNVKKMFSMFSHCSSLKILDLSSFITKNVEDMSFMFFKCSSLNKLKIPYIKTNPNININFIFSKCNSLNISDFQSYKKDDIDRMFKELNY